MMVTIQTNIRKDQLITMYLPIFRAKLKRLEHRGQAHTARAAELRETLAVIDLAITGVQFEHKGSPISLAAD
jgi:hypothetical protein